MVEFINQVQPATALFPGKSSYRYTLLLLILNLHQPLTFVDTTTVTLKKTVICDVTPSSVVHTFLRFGDKSRLYPQGGR